MRKFLAILFILISLSACKSVNSSNAFYNYYSNSQYSFYYSKNWIEYVSKVKFSDTIELRIAPKKDIHDIFYFSDKEKKEPKNIDEFFKKIEENYEIAHNNPTKYSLNEFYIFSENLNNHSFENYFFSKINELRSIKNNIVIFKKINNNNFEVEINYAKVNSYQKSYSEKRNYFFKNGKAFILVYKVLPEKREEYKPSEKLIFKTFKFNDSI